MKRRRVRARRGKYLAILACTGLAAVCLFLALDSREQILSLSRERKVEFRLEREDGTGEKNGQREEQEKGRTRTRFGIVFRLEDGELILYRERQEAE